MTVYNNYKPSNKGILDLLWPLQSSVLEQIAPTDSVWTPAPTNHPVNSFSLCSKWQTYNWLTSPWKKVPVVIFYTLTKNSRAPVIPNLHSLFFTQSINIMSSLPWQPDLNKTLSWDYTCFSVFTDEVICSPLVSMNISTIKGSIFARYLLNSQWNSSPLRPPNH